MLVIVININIQKLFFCETFLYTQKSKQINPFYMTNIVLTKYWELSWAILMKIFIFERSQQFNSYTIVHQFTK